MPVEEVEPGTILELESEPAGRIVVHGANCRIRVGRNVRLGADIAIHSEVSNATIEIGDDCDIYGVIRFVRGDGGVLRIGNGTNFNGVGLSMHEAGKITIGRDCMLSTDIHMDVSDMHPIFDRSTGERLNPAQDIFLGDHVWLSTRVLVLKGSRIGSGTVVGAGAMVAGELPENVLAIGSPARVVRTNVPWTRKMDMMPELHRPKAASWRTWWRPWRALLGSNP